MTSQLGVRLLDSEFLLRGTAGELAELSALTGRCDVGADAIDVDVTGDALDQTLALLNMTAVAQCRSFAVHAAAVLVGATAVALPAESGSGKSTMAAALVREGCQYLSDEALVLDWDTGDVRPYPKWFSLSPWSAEQVGLTPGHGAESFFTVEQLGGAPAGAARLGAVVMLDRRTGPPSLEALSRAEAARLLLMMSFNHYQQPRRAFALVTQVVAGCQAWRLGVDDPRAAARLLVERIGS